MKKILIIDDYKPLLEEVVEFLQMEGYDTSSATNGAEGVQKALQIIPDLIICDINMPHINGYQVYSSLRDIPETQNIPFIFLTAKVQPDDFRKGLKLGVDDYITKPFDLDEITLSIKNQLEKYERIKNSEKIKLEALINNTLTGVFMLQEDRFIFANEKFCEISQFSQEEILNFNFFELAKCSNKKKITLISDCQSGKIPVIETQITITTKNGLEVLLDFYGKNLELEGKNTLLSNISVATEKTAEEQTSLELIIRYLKNNNKQKIADELISVTHLLKTETKKRHEKIINSVNLTKRENEVLNLICKGLKNNEISEKLYISSRTVDNHRANILLKTNTKNTAQLVAFAIKNKLVNA